MSSIGRPVLDVDDSRARPGRDPLRVLRAKVGVFADLFRKSEELARLSLELEERVRDRTAARSRP